MENAKDKAVIAALVEAFNKNGGVDGKVKTHIDEFIDIVYRFEVQDSDCVRYYMMEAIWDDNGLTDELINETVCVFRENAFEAAIDDSNPWGDDHGDFDGYYGKQYYQNPRGRCEDAPCCGCCGMM